MKSDIKSQWFSLASKYTKDDFLINSLWLEISKHYSEKNRYYHTLSHVQNMLLQAKSFEDKIVDFDALLFAIWYHDIIYKSTKKDNEEKSALFAIILHTHTTACKHHTFEQKPNKTGRD